MYKKYKTYINFIKKYFLLKTFKLDNIKEILLFVVENVMRFQLFLKSLFFDTR